MCGFCLHSALNKPANLDNQRRGNIKELLISLRVTVAHDYGFFQTFLLKMHINVFMGETTQCLGLSLEGWQGVRGEDEIRLTKRG